jgi:hypothetical protein
MRTREEIEANLAETKLELKDAYAMYDSEMDAYNKNMSFWGEAERTGVEHSNHIIDVLISKINALNWVLEN